MPNTSHGLTLKLSSRDRQLGGEATGGLGRVRVWRAAGGPKIEAPPNREARTGGQATGGASGGCAVPDWWKVEYRRRDLDLLGQCS